MEYAHTKGMELVAMEEKVKVVLTNIEDYVKRCRKVKVPEIYFKVSGKRLQDGRGVLTAELTAIEPAANYLAQLTYVKTLVSAQPFANPEDEAAFSAEFERQMKGGSYEVKRDGKVERIDVVGIIPYIQREYPSCEVINGWIGW